MLRVAGVLAAEHDAGAMAVWPVFPASRHLDGLCCLAADGRGAMTPRLVVADNPALPLVVTAYAGVTRIDVPVSPLRALALAAGGRLRAAAGFG